MRGRKPKATAEHKEAGTFRKDRHQRRPADPLKRLPRAPDWLTDLAAEKWAEAGRDLIDAGILTELDLDALANYAEAWSTWRRAMAELDEHGGLTFTTDKGGIRKHPAVSIAENANKAVLALQERLGLTPLARLRIRVDVGGDDEADIKEFLPT